MISAGEKNVHLNFVLPGDRVYLGDGKSFHEIKEGETVWRDIAHENESRFEEILNDPKNKELLNRLIPEPRFNRPQGLFMKPEWSMTKQISIEEVVRQMHEIHRAIICTDDSQSKISIADRFIHRCAEWRKENEEENKEEDNVVAGTYHPSIGIPLREVYQSPEARESVMEANRPGGWITIPWPTGDDSEGIQSEEDSQPMPPNNESE